MKSSISPNRLAKRGFSLMVTLLLMMLLTVIALGMLSLSAITLRQSGHARNLAIARANARMAMNLALGNLQKTLGPDGRVSASASLLDSNPATEAVEGVTNPQWTGVWIASKPKANGTMETPWTRDDADGGLKDARATGGWPRTSVLDWLVSRPANAPVDALTAQREGTWVRLVNTGSADDDVWAPTVEIAGDEQGRYGWWVGDEGVKAKIKVPDAWAGKQPDPMNAANGGYFHWLASQKSDGSIVDPTFDIPEEQKARVVTHGSLELGTRASRQAVRLKFHDFTAHSLGLPVDVPHSRLKRDLSAYLAGSGAIADLTAGGKVVSPGLADDDRLVGPANSAAAARSGITWTKTLHQKSSPRFGLLRRWSQTSPNYPVNAGSGRLIAPPAVAASADTESSFDYTNGNVSAVSPLSTPSLTPVLVEGSIYYQLAAENTPTDPATPWHLVAHLYPRVVIWNPYNITLQVPASSLMLQINGMKSYLVKVSGAEVQRQFYWALDGARNGSLYLGLSSVTLAPGACAVFSPTKRAPYLNQNPQANLLSPSVPPSRDRGLTIDLSVGDASSKYTVAPTSFRENATGATQADDYRMLWKEGSAGTFDAFRRLPQLAFVSCGVQYGEEDEPPLAWDVNTPVEIPTGTAGTAYSIPYVDKRTRDGFRLRWLNETAANKSNSGSLSGTSHFDIAPLGNWNPRAAYSIRNPYDNLTDSAPFFFGAYTRDLFDSAIDFDALAPVPRDGLQQSWPFGPPGESPGPVVLFDVPRKETGVLSLAQFQHAKLSEFIWHPSYAVGNSLADPRLENRTDRTAPVARSAGEKDKNGWTKAMLGSNVGSETWSYYARGLISGLPETDAVVHDLSFEVNQSLWDDFFLSTGTAAQKQALVQSSESLPNGRMRVTRSAGGESDLLKDLADFHRAASRIGIDGAFNVNSTRVDAWKAVLAGTRGVGAAGDETLFPRLLDAPGGEYKDGQSSAKGSEAWSGSRVLDDAAIDRLARAIVVEVKKRGPFLSLADFVNRRLALGETGKTGALEAAIQACALNNSLNQAFKLDQRAMKDCNNAFARLADSTRLDPRSMPPSKAWGAPGYLTQADILQPLGPQLAPRSDTFVIRAYGDSRSSSGAIEARAWCEAVVQRLPDPVTPDAAGLNPINPGAAGDFGRRFIITGFRWMTASEI